jgi:hypothetical protein
MGRPECFAQFADGRLHDAFDIGPLADSGNDLTNHCLALGTALGLLEEASVFQGQPDLSGNLLEERDLVGGPLSFDSYLLQADGADDLVPEDDRGGKGGLGMALAVGAVGYRHPVFHRQVKFWQRLCAFGRL